MFRRGPCQHHLSFRVPKLPQRRCSNVKRDAALIPQHSRASVYVLDINQDPRPEPDFVECGVVLAHCDLVIGAGGVVGPGWAFHDLFCDGLEVDEVVALLKDGHVCDSLLACRLSRVICLHFGLDGGHVDGAEVLGLVEVLWGGLALVFWD